MRFCGVWPVSLWYLPDSRGISRLAAGEVRAEIPDPTQSEANRIATLDIREMAQFRRRDSKPLNSGRGVLQRRFGAHHQTDPKYGTDSKAFASQFGASFADIATQNFFGDFVLASAFHEDPRYSRRGPPYRFWSRFGYAVSRSVIIRTDSGGESFNWSNVLGSAMSAGLSNAYYPPASRSSRATVLHFALATVGAGLGNLAPEFWPDFKKKVFKRHN